MSKSPFKPHFLLRNRHVQTTWRTLFEKRQSISVRFERFDLDDGDFIDIASTPPTSGPILLLLHGLEGSLESPYVRGVLHTAAQKGWQGILMHFRGCSGPVNRTLIGYHSGETEDLLQFLKHLRQQYPNKPILAAGFSLGGNVLLKYLGESQDDALIDAAVAVSVPYSLKECSKQIHKGASRFYGRILLNSLKNSASRKMRLHQEDSVFGLSIKAVERFQTIREFDDGIIAPMWGFKDALDYYEQCSSRQFLKGISRPTLLIHSTDDPFMIPEVIPKKSELSSAISLEVSRHGGHVGFIQGPPWKPSYWLDQRIPAYFEEILKEMSISELESIPRHGEDTLLGSSQAWS